MSAVTGLVQGYVTTCVDAAYGWTFKIFISGSLSFSLFLITQLLQTNSLPELLVEPLLAVKFSFVLISDVFRGTASAVKFGLYSTCALHVLED